jgi:hypothetical protein
MGCLRKKASPKGGHLESSVTINCRLVMIPVAITVVIFLDDDSVPIPMLVTITQNCSLAISITIAVMSGANGYAGRSDTDSNVFRTRRHCSTNARDGGNHQSVFHHVLLML